MVDGTHGPQDDAGVGTGKETRETGLAAQTGAGDLSGHDARFTAAVDQQRILWRAVLDALAHDHEPNTTD